MATKTVTSWKSKKVYPILAPENFDYQEIGETIASEPDRLAGRTVNVSLGELMGDRGKNYMNLVFEVTDAKGDKAHTKFKRYFIPSGYLRSKVRKRTAKIDYSADLSFGERRLKVKIMVLSRHRASNVQEAEIKARINGILAEHGGVEADKFVQQILFGKLGTEIYKRIKSICPIMRVEVYEIEMLN
jgi:small subunit ribosomal protein S3Ae